jgi:hypothetical protein
MMIAADLDNLGPAGGPGHKCQFSQGKAKCLGESLERGLGCPSVDRRSGHGDYQGVDVVASTDLGPAGAGLDPDGDADG